MIHLLYISTLSFAWEIKSNSAGQNLHWKEREISFYINTGTSPIPEEEAKQAILSASQSWNFSTPELIFQGTTNQRTIDHRDEEFTIFFDHNWSEDPDILAFAYTWSNEEGEIVHFDIAINAEHHDWSADGSLEKHDLQNTVTHEFGHVLGLDHSSIPEATMSPSAPAGELSKRELHEDDLLGYHVIYPEQLASGSSEETEDSPEENTNSNHQGTTSSGGTRPPATKGGYGLTMPEAGCAHQKSAPGGWMFLFGLLLWRRIQKS
ncbi:MAG: matrixin family metalloprotease [Myxococcota bacterium]|nr:matrixin family metalloprotease [Myxococcota bacterium]